MAATTTLLGLVTPTQGTLTGTWGDTVNYGISDYLDIAIAGTLSFAGDGAITLANTTGSSSGNSIGATTAQYAIIKVTGTLTTAKIITGPSYSKTYLVVNAATGSTVTFKASGQTGVSIAVGETAFVYYNGTDYVKVVGTATAGAAGGSNTQVQYNNSGVLAGITGATTNGTALTLVAPNLGSPASVGTMPAFTLGGTVSGGGNQINNVVIGTTTPLAGAFTSLTASTTLGVTGVSTLTGGAVVQGLTVGLGAGAVATNTTVGSGALGNNSTGAQNTAVGYQAGLSITSGDKNTAFGASIMDQGAGVTGQENAAFGRVNMRPLTSGSYNTALGNESLLKLTSGSYNTAVGFDALLENTTGPQNTAVGYQAGYGMTTGSEVVFVGNEAGKNISGAFNTAVGSYALTNFGGSAASGSGTNNIAFGKNASFYNTSGSYNVALGSGALLNNTTAANNTAVGYQAGYSNLTGRYNVFVGAQAGYNTTGEGNTFISGGNNSSGYPAGHLMTTGSDNVVIGGYGGNQDSLDIRTASSYVVLATGNGNRQITMAEGQTLALDSAVPNSGTGITFPASDSPSSNANTLDDYEEGIWTPTQGAGLTVVGAFSSSGRYTKIGRLVSISGRIAGATSIATTAGTIMFTGIPFTIAEATAVGTFTNDSINVIGGIGGFTTTVYSATTIGATTVFDFSLTFSV